MEISGAELIDKVQELSGQDIFSCYQCGICTGSCPFAAEMDLGPRRMLACLIEGRTEVLEANTPWICASCFQCVVRCPNDIDIAAVSEAVRQISQRQGIGGGSDLALKLAKLSLLRPVGARHPDARIGSLEVELHDLINESGVGPMGMGGRTTCLDVHIEYAHRHPASLPVGIVYQCWADRRGRVKIRPDGAIEVI